jgi:hypothetical protein
VSKGISWRQVWMLRSIAEANRSDVVAWMDIDCGPTSAEGSPDYFSPRVQWNHEQSVRRALRSLERRGLVELGRYVFNVSADIVGGYPRIMHDAAQPEAHVPGQSRIMTGARLTDAGRLAVAADEARAAGRRAPAASSMGSEAS